MSKMAKKLKPLPCPCCGNNNIYTGSLSSISQGVECMMMEGGCRLSLEQFLGEYDYLPDTQTIKQYERDVLNKAITMWNKRVKNV